MGPCPNPKSECQRIHPFWVLVTSSVSCHRRPRQLGTTATEHTQRRPSWIRDAPHFAVGFDRGVSPCVNPLMLRAPKSSLAILMRSCRATVKSGKYFKGKCYSGHYQQLPFKYFVRSFLILKLLSKVSQIQTTIWGENLYRLSLVYIQCQALRETRTTVCKQQPDTSSGDTHSSRREDLNRIQISTTNVVCFSVTFANNLGILQKFAKNLKESCWSCYGQSFSFKFKSFLGLKEVGDECHLELSHF